MVNPADRGGFKKGWSGNPGGQPRHRKRDALPGPLPLLVSVVVSLPPGLASLVVVSAFCSSSVVGAERAA